MSSPQEFEIEELKHTLKIIQSISYTHFTELLKIDDSVKRRFYELLILKTQPSVKELRRQIESLTFERIGLTKNQEISFHDLVAKIQPEKAGDLVKSHYFFEFLEIPQAHIIEENDLEQALISHLL